MSKLNITKTQFCLGISKPLDILNKNTKKLINFALDNHLYIHTSISYPVNFFFIKHLLDKNQKKKINFICKILADSNKNFKETVNLTFKKFSIEKIHILQLVNLPVSNAINRNASSLNMIEFNEILNLIKELKKKNLIEKVYVQIFSKDSLEFCINLSNYFDGFAFYSNIHEIHLKKDVYEFIKKNNIPSMLLSVFGNPKEKKTTNNLHIDSYNFSQSYFSDNIIPVGRTLNVDRLKDIVTNNKINNLKFSPKFIETNEIQDTEKNFYNRYRVSSLSYIFIFVLKCLIKKIMGQKTVSYLKKIVNNYK